MSSKSWRPSSSNPWPSIDSKKFSWPTARPFQNNIPGSVPTPDNKVGSNVPKSPDQIKAEKGGEEESRDTDRQIEFWMPHF